MTDPTTAAAEEYAATVDCVPYEGYDDQDLIACFLAGHAYALRERDAYAKAMAIALREGIFAEKARVLREIESVLAAYKSACGTNL